MSVTVQFHFATAALAMAFMQQTQSLAASAPATITAAAPTPTAPAVGNVSSDPFAAMTAGSTPTVQAGAGAALDFDAQVIPALKAYSESPGNNFAALMGAVKTSAVPALKTRPHTWQPLIDFCRAPNAQTLAAVQAAAAQG